MSDRKCYKTLRERQTSYGRGDHYPHSAHCVQGMSIWPIDLSIPYVVLCSPALGRQMEIIWLLWSLTMEVMLPFLCDQRQWRSSWLLFHVTEAMEVIMVTIPCDRGNECHHGDYSMWQSQWRSSWWLFHVTEAMKVIMVTIPCDRGNEGHHGHYSMWQRQWRSSWWLFHVTEAMARDNGCHLIISCDFFL